MLQKITKNNMKNTTIISARHDTMLQNIIKHNMKNTTIVSARLINEKTTK